MKFRTPHSKNVPPGRSQVKSRGGIVKQFGTSLTILAALAAAYGCASTAPRAQNACELLSKDEVRAVQGEAFSGTHLTASGKSSQCFYELPLFVNSVSVDWIRDGREVWERMFEAGERKEGEGEEERKAPPKRVKGIGDEAFWIGNRAVGSLYVRRRGAVVRVSVGGKGTEEEKIERSKQLAAAALRRI
jgi:hypothetical protein